jgi:hypothetical protein
MKIITNDWLQNVEQGGRKKVAPSLEAPLMEASPQILTLKSKLRYSIREPLQGGVLSGGLKNLNPH